MAPGVDSAIAIILAISPCVNQPSVFEISYRNGKVANPPPMEKSPTLKNSKNNCNKIILLLLLSSGLTKLRQQMKREQ